MFNSDDNMNTIENFTSIKMNISENLDIIYKLQSSILNQDNVPSSKKIRSAPFICNLLNEYASTAH